MNENQRDDYPRFNEELPGYDNVAPVAAPPVILWYRLYCIAMVLEYVLLMAVGAATVLFHEQLPDTPGIPPVDDTLVGLRGIIIMMVCGIFFIANLAALFLPKRAWAWFYHLVNIALGLPNCIILAVPLLILWLKPATQAYFGKVDAPRNTEEPQVTL